MDSHKKNNILYILIFILLVLVLVLTGYIVYTNLKNNKTTETDLIAKIDDTKDWVYDAEYVKNVTVDSYSTNFNTYFSNDIVVPYININSSYANEFNNDIKKVFDDAIKTYNNGVNDKMSYVGKCDYEKYINNDSLSVVLTYGVGATDVVKNQYYTYNIDLKTGKQLTYEEVYSIAGFSSDNIDSKVENAIVKIMKEKTANLSYPEGTSFDTFNKESINNYKNSINTKTIKYFLSNNGKLNIVVKLSIPVGTWSFDTIITVD